MSNEIDDLREFNSKVESGSSHNSVTAKHYGDSVASESPEVTGEPKTGASVNAQMWAVYGENCFSPCEKAVGTLPPGQYTIEASQALGIFFRRTTVNIDELVPLPDSVSDSVVQEIEKFWTKEQHFRSFGFLWKRGVLMWGPPGSGKTSTLQVISERIVKHGGLSVYVTNPSRAAEGLKLMRQVEPHRPIVVMLEDLDAIIDRHGEADLLAMLDGELQIDNVVFVATTNYPEKLDKRFINRPSRFDIVKKIGMPNEEARAVYLASKNTRLAGTDELHTWVELTKSFSVAHLKELIVSVEVFEVPLKDAVARLKTMMEHTPKSSDAEERKFGFN